MVAPSAPTNEDIARVAHSLWEAEGRPDGKDHEHWDRARALLENGEADPRSPMPGPRDPEPIPPTSDEGHVAIASSADVAAGSLVDDPATTAAKPAPKRRTRKAADTDATAGEPAPKPAAKRTRKKPAP